MHYFLDFLDAWNSGSTKVDQHMNRKSQKMGIGGLLRLRIV